MKVPRRTGHRREHEWDSSMEVSGIPRVDPWISAVLLH